ncbi:MAG: GNAT family N-acetyltransferase [Alphaproteobacteria bacterium]|nr:GNAT family N-acetyltransferase [Alphaproteobacteria bacterium]
MNIRRYVPADLDAVMDLFRESVRRVAIRDYSEAQVQAWAPDVPDRERWAERRASRPTWIAEIDGRLAGFADLEPDGHVDMMYVHPDHQGRGVANALMKTVESEAARLGLGRLYTEASITAKPFFERKGFRVIAPQTVSLRGMDFINYRMEKPLA